ncbi:hypothetical protein B296_00033080 [Ensete ventricosum]|uniref:Transmembrane protein n=1 Tax=Ensete ventricosum TaxID=4639 RepID=A0A427A9Z7_ENSVE|nr:hypothetical protein B296_00033080 [Ensete ventricosum]
MLTQRLRSSGRAIFRTVSPRIWGGNEGAAFKLLAFPNLKRKTSNTWSAVQDTYLSTKVATFFLNFGSLLSFFSTCFVVSGYTLRQIHQSNVEKRLESLEQALVLNEFEGSSKLESVLVIQLKSSYKMEHEEIKKIASSGNISSSACVAIAGTSLVIGFVPTYLLVCYF